MSARSPAREDLAEAIEKRDEAQRRLAALESAGEKAKADRLAAVRMHDLAERAVAEARSTEHDELVARALRRADRAVGAELLDEQSAEDAERNLRRAEAWLDECRRTDTAVRSAIGDAEREAKRAERAVSAAIAAVVAADPATAKAVDSYRALAAAFVTLEQTLRWLEIRGMLPEGVHASRQYLPEGFPDQAWLRAVEVLHRDPDATLPGA